MLACLCAMDTQEQQARLLIVWHSRTGASEALAQAAAQAASPEITVDLCAARDTGPDTVIAASAYLFVCPENLASMSGAMKEFFDRCYYPVLGRIEGRPYGTIIAAGSDGSGAQRQIDRIVTGWRLRRVVDPLIVNFAAHTAQRILAPKTVPEPELQQARELAAALGAGTAMGVF